MKIQIQHKTEYQFETPPYSGLQRLHLKPVSLRAQTVENWVISLQGAHEEAEYRDHFGNMTHLIKICPQTDRLEIAVEGVVQTQDVSGVMGDDDKPLPLWLFKQNTPLTTPKAGLSKFIKSLGTPDTSPVFFHEVSNAIREHIAYSIGSSDTQTSAEQAWHNQTGVCQDHSHVFIAVARALGTPARYVSGYLLMDDTIAQTATHAWAEVYLKGLGWVGFDVSNGISPDARYVKLATGRDYTDALPIKGVRYGAGQETLDVSLQIQQ